MNKDNLGLSLCEYIQRLNNVSEDEKRAILESLKLLLKEDIEKSDKITDKEVAKCVVDSFIELAKIMLL
ncbi:MAG: hypothetical protein NC038_03385 [Paludibacter sp.]|nr:hypothetical protein [Bacteroidales bacterium]MCM1069087.1 hypothetical protein [Prevotella sp.]MCM1353526.1 hypothetical protein [Bacteroides sp.]MCM1442687.1 hypothetical protein [Muribaculum sp.]MCM1481677.1 hypothetical protein [Paludibacter sp.]